MKTKAETKNMNASDLIKEAEEQISLFERPSSTISRALISMVSSQDNRIAELEKAQLKSDLLVMSNARRLIKAKAITSNGRLYSELFGTGCGTGRERCRDLGLDPDCNKTDYHQAKALKEKGE